MLYRVRRKVMNCTKRATKSLNFIEWSFHSKQDTNDVYLKILCIGVCALPLHVLWSHQSTRRAIKKIFVAKRCVQAKQETNERKKTKRIDIRGSFNVAIHRLVGER